MAWLPVLAPDTETETGRPVSCNATESTPQNADIDPRVNSLATAALALQEKGGWMHLEIRSHASVTLEEGTLALALPFGRMHAVGGSDSA